MEQEKFFLEVDNGKVAGVVHKPEEDSKGTVVFCHGFGSDKEGSYKRRCSIASEKGFKAVRFDFRGNNESSMEFSDSNLSTRISDLEAVVGKFGEDDLMVYGASFGGLVCLQTAIIDERIDVVSLRAPVTYFEALEDIRKSIEENGRYEHIPGKHVGEKFLEDLRKYSIEEVVEEIETPTLVMHGTEDEVVPIKYSKKFFKQIQCPKKFREFGGQGHRFDNDQDNVAVLTALEWFKDNGS